MAEASRRSRILIADDNAVNVEILEAFLADADYEIGIAVDGRDTLDKVKTFQPDLILLTRGGLEAVGGEDGLWSLPGMSQIPAGREWAFVALDDMLLLGFGPRVEEAILALRCGLTDSARRGR